MKVGLDVSGCYRAMDGVSNYSYNLARALLQMCGGDKFLLYPIFYTHYLNRQVRRRIFEKTTNSRVLFQNNNNSLLNLLWSPLSPPFIKEWLLGDANIIHSTTFAAPKFRNPKKRLVVTIYDMTFLTHPSCHTQRNISISTSGVRKAIKNADAIIAISEHTKKDIIEYLRVPSDLVTVTHLAAGDDFFPIKDTATLSKVRHKYHLPEQYILFLGSLEPRKNVKSLIEAFFHLPTKLQNEFPLVIAGGKGWLNSDVSKRIIELGLVDKVHFAGFIDSSDISAVYSGATIFVYPSLYEGFGLPILEAMSCGTPVIASNTSSMPEVAGSAAFLVDPTNVEELSWAIRKILEDEELRRKMRGNGLFRSGLFSWDQCAKDTLDVYKRIL